MNALQIFFAGLATALGLMTVLWLISLALRNSQHRGYLLGRGLRGGGLVVLPAHAAGLPGPETPHRRPRHRLGGCAFRFTSRAATCCWRSWRAKGTGSVSGWDTEHEPMRYEHRFRVRAPLAAVADFHSQAASMPAITPPPMIVRVHLLGAGRCGDVGRDAGVVRVSGVEDAAVVGRRKLEIGSSRCRYRSSRASRRRCST